MLQYQWAKLETGQYCPLKSLNLTKVSHITGIYVIWHTGLKPRAVRLGQGLIGVRLHEHLNDPEIMGYEHLGTYVASWIIPPAAFLDGIERYLGNTLQPLVGSRFPDVVPIEVNLP